MSGDWDIVDDEPAPTPVQTADDRINPERVRDVMLQRRAANRAIQWALVIGIVAMLAAAWAVVRLTLARDRPTVVATAAAGAVAIVVALRARRRWVQLRSDQLAAIEADHASLPPPDFTPLSDGRQAARALDELTRAPDQQS